jgi:hypothetical protein
MKALLLLTAIALAACTTDPAGNKAFLGLNSAQWIGVGSDAAKSATQTAVVSYGTRRALTAAKQPVSVNP